MAGTVTVKTRSKAAFAIVQTRRSDWLDGPAWDAKVIGYAYSEAAAKARLRRLGVRVGVRFQYAPILDGKATVEVPS